MPRPRRFAPAVEALEDRVTPAVHTWDGGGVTAVWSDNANWANDDNPSVGESDVVIVFNTAAGTTVQDIPDLVVETVRFDAGATATVQLTTTLILDGAGAANTLVDRTGTNAITGPGTLVLTGAAATVLVDPTAGRLTLAVGLVGTQGFTKTGTGVLELTGTTDSTYTGPTTVAAGELFLNTTTDDAGISGTIVVGDGAGVAQTAILRLVNSSEVPDAATVTVEDDGLLDVTGTPVEGVQSLTLNGGVAALAAGSTLRLLGGAVTTGASDLTSQVTGTGTLELLQAATFTVADGAAATDLRVDAVVFNAGAASGLVKTGAGRMVLTANNSYGPTTVNAGTLEVNGSQTAGTVAVAGGTLGGTGGVGALTATGGTVAPGVTGGVTGARLAAGTTALTNATFAARLFGPGGTPGVQFDASQLSVTGTVTLTNVTLAATRAGTAPAAGRPFLILANDGTDPVVGTFAGLAEGAAVTVTGQTFRITYAGGDGNDVLLVAGAVDPLPNQPPVAVNDAATTPPDTAVTVSVLANDSDPDGGTLTVTAVTTPANGTATVNANGTVRYVPNAAFTGTDSFTYTITDGQGGSAAATVRITVADTPVTNRPPVAVADSATTRFGTAVTIPVLANDSDPDGGTLTVTVGPLDTPRGGIARVNADGTITYSPFAGGFAATDSFTYTLSDGQGGTATAVVTVEVVRPPVQLAEQFAVGLDRGGNGTARLFNPDRTTRIDTTPFSGSAAAGVRTATADFNGDGVADLVVGSGPGGVTRVRVLDGATQAELFNVQPFEDAFTGGVYVAAGDITGDGVADLVITPDEGGGPRVRVFSGVRFGLIADFFGIEDTQFRGGARAAVGDLNGDGVADLVVAAGFGGGPRVAGFDGTSILSGVFTRKLFPDFFAFEAALRNGAYVAAGDVDGDGLADLIAGGGPGGGPRVTAFSGAGLLAGRQTQVANFFSGDQANRGGVRVAVKDLDGDARADLLTGSGPGGGSRVTAYAGTAVTSPTPAELFAFDAQPGFAGGVFVG